MDEDNKMPVLIKSCKEVPVSLLYGSRPRLSSVFDSGNNWMPTRLDGDALTHGTLLRKVFYDGQYSYVLETNCCKTDSILSLGSLPGQQRTFNSTMPFRWINQASNIDLVLEPSPGHFVVEETLKDARDCFLIDLSAGTPSLMDLAATVAHFKIETSTSEAIVLCYVRPLTVWGTWERYSNPLTEMPEPLTMEKLQFDMPARKISSEMLTNRPLLAVVGATTAVVAIVLLITVVFSAIMILSVDDPNEHGDSVSPPGTPTIPLWILVSYYVYEPVRRRLAMPAYMQWLKSFENDVEYEAYSDIHRSWLANPLDFFPLRLPSRVRRGFRRNTNDWGRQSRWSDAGRTGTRSAAQLLPSGRFGLADTWPSL